MPDHQLPKPVKRALKQIIGEGYENALAQELAALSGEFEQWKTGKIGAFDLEERIHEFHDGTARRLYSEFSTRGVTLTYLAAYAVHAGFYDAARVPADVFPYIQTALKLLREES
ncbi:MAG TPA: hypothetical protein VML19_11020 [Verrucomicrobiae bacterium]|nr:hypothetical protein [Verrucomicrobiae bacterium]